MVTVRGSFPWLHVLPERGAVELRELRNFRLVPKSLSHPFLKILHGVLTSAKLRSYTRLPPEVGAANIQARNATQLSDHRVGRCRVTSPRGIDAEVPKANEVQRQRILRVQSLEHRARFIPRFQIVECLGQQATAILSGTVSKRLAVPILRQPAELACRVRVLMEAQFTRRGEKRVMCRAECPQDLQPLSELVGMSECRKCPCLIGDQHWAIGSDGGDAVTRLAEFAPVVAARVQYCGRDFPEAWPSPEKSSLLPRASE